jgi:hypothetical protein
LNKIYFIIFPFTAFIISFLLLAADHYGFGYVTIPEWYEREPFSFEPFPVEEVISYWIKRDLVFSFLTALLTFCCCLLGSLIGTKTKFRRQQGGC